MNIQMHVETPYYEYEFEAEDCRISLTGHLEAYKRN